LQALRVARWAWAVLACPLTLAAAEPPAVVTLLEGSATLTRGVGRHALAEGVRLQSGDILEIADKGLCEMEFAEGAALALGPGSRTLAITLPHAKPAPGDFYLVQGVAKLSRTKPATRVRVITPLLALHTAEGTSVLLVQGGEASVFVESGEVRVSAPAASSASAAQRLKSGDFYTVKAGQKGVLAGRPSPAFVNALPRVFLDPLPSRLARFKDRPVQPRPLHAASYAEVETWLKAPPAIRRPMLARFQSRAGDPAFRAALVENLRFHPEWDPILFPEKYLPKEPEAAAASGPAAATRPPAKR
jgi:hypothetical protein